MAESLGSKAFRISYVVMVGVVFLGSLGSGLVGGRDKDDAASGGAKTAVAVVGSLPQDAVGAASLDVVSVNDVEDAERMVRDGSVEAAIVPTAPDTPGKLTVVALEETPADVVAAVTVAPQVRLLEPPAANEFLLRFFTILFGALFWAMVMGFGVMSAQSTVVEKQTRVVEILLATVPARVLLAGKVLANSILALATMASMALAGVGGLALVGNAEVLSLITAPAIWFVVFFGVGFVLFSAILSGSASLVSRLEDVSSVLFPTQMVAMIPYIMVVALQNNDLLMTICSYIPISAPATMPARIMAGSAAWWEPFVSLAILALTTWGAILVSGKMYTGSVLQTGTRVKVRDALANA
jgi:ABC-2 type transport system permease protein